MTPCSGLAAGAWLRRMGLTSRIAAPHGLGGNLGRKREWCGHFDGHRIMRGFSGPIRSTASRKRRRSSIPSVPAPAPGTQITRGLSKPMRSSASWKTLILGAINGGAVDADQLDAEAFQHRHGVSAWILARLSGTLPTACGNL